MLSYVHNTCIIYFLLHFSPFYHLLYIFSSKTGKSKKSNSSHLLHFLLSMSSYIACLFYKLNFTRYLHSSTTPFSLHNFSPFAFSSTRPYPYIYYVCSTYTSFTDYLLFPKQNNSNKAKKTRRTRKLEEWKVQL